MKIQIATFLYIALFLLALFQQTSALSTIKNKVSKNKGPTQFFNF